jgi:hypothetical protein
MLGCEKHPSFLSHLKAPERKRKKKINKMCSCSDVSLLLLLLLVLLLVLLLCPLKLFFLAQKIVAVLTSRL